MKKTLTLLALTISFSLNAQLTSVTEGGNTGQRLSISNASYHGDIGSNAVDLSYQPFLSSTRGATGGRSTAMGYNTTASGANSTSMGSGTTASGNNSTAMGVGTEAGGTTSIAMGDSSTASGYVSTAMGYNTTASGDYSTAMGYLTTSSGNNSTAMGYGTTASGGYGAIAMGDSSTASGRSSTAMGYLTTSSGNNSTAMGYYTTASDYGSLVIGQYNSSGSSATSAASFSTSAPAFVIGNGTNSSNKSDAFKVMFNGDTTVGGDITISSDARLKSNIVSLGSTLSKLLLIDGKSYEKDGKQRIGVLAQEIQEVFPELVTEDGNEMLAVNYQGLVPVLINALKEQQSEIDELKEMVQKLVNRK